MPYRTGKELADAARSRVRELRAKEALELHASTGGHVFLDVREPNEWNLGRIPGAVHIPRGNLESKVEALVGRDKPVIVYCGNGSRSALAAVTLGEMGYDNVASMSDGWAGWVGADGEVEG